MSSNGQRPTKDEFFMEMVQVARKRSTCLRRSVGAVLVVNDRAVAIGYNGAPIGFKHADEVGCYRQTHNIPSGQQLDKCRGIHAEQNVILQAARFGIATDGATLYCSTKPCSTCAKLIVGAGITRIVYEEDYNDDFTDNIIEEAKTLGIEFVQYKR